MSSSIQFFCQPKTAFVNYIHHKIWVYHIQSLYTIRVSQIREYSIWQEETHCSKIFWFYPGKFRSWHMKFLWSFHFWYVKCFHYIYNATDCKVHSFKVKNVVNGNHIFPQSKRNHALSNKFNPGNTDLERMSMPCSFGYRCLIVIIHLDFSFEVATLEPKKCN